MTVDIRLQLVTLLPRLRRFALALAGDRTRADDLVQATCERALRSADLWTPGTRLDSWLYKIMQNLWIDDRRRAVAEAPGGLDGVPEPIGDDGEHIAHTRLELREISRALEDLPPEQRAVVVLVCVENLSYRETAEAVGVPVGTVMSRLARARAALAAALGLLPGSADLRARRAAQ